jgi:hypothetical protein
MEKVKRYAFCKVLDRSHEDPIPEEVSGKLKRVIDRIG